MLAPVKALSRRSVPLFAALTVFCCGVAAVRHSPWWWWLSTASVLALVAVGLRDLRQRSDAALRGHPAPGRARSATERIRPEVRRRFGASNPDGRPLPREPRSPVCEGTGSPVCEGTERRDPAKALGAEPDLYARGHEFFVPGIYAELYEWLERGELLRRPGPGRAADRDLASPDTVNPGTDQRP